MLQNKEISNESAREIEGAPRRTQPRGVGHRAPPPQAGLSHADRQMLLFFFFSLLILTDKTDAGRRDREIIYYYVVPSNISERKRARAKPYKFSLLVQIKPPE